jgi:hypothetical protein
MTPDINIRNQHLSLYKYPLIATLASLYFWLDAATARYVKIECAATASGK